MAVLVGVFATVGNMVGVADAKRIPCKANVVASADAMVDPFDTTIAVLVGVILA